MTKSSAKNCLILLISQNENLRETVEKYALFHEALLEIVQHAEAAKNLLQNAEFDCVLLDDTAVNRSTWEKFYLTLPNTPLIILNTDQDTWNIKQIQAWMRLGANDILPNTASPQEISDSLQLLFERTRSSLPIIDLNSQAIDMIGHNPSILNIKRQICRIARLPSPVLLSGATGSGKSHFAGQIHHLSGRKGDFITINCASLSPELIESELFGHQKGAFTGASQNRAGLFSAAHQGTLFLDEIAELPLNLQAKLLHVLEHSSLRPLGADHTVNIDVRIIAASHQALAERVANHSFRADLFYRLSVIPLNLPTLNERQDDIPEFVAAFIAQLSKQLQVPCKIPEQKVMDKIIAHSWPGNIRELRNYIERSIALGFPLGNQLPTCEITKQDSENYVNNSWKRLDELEKQHILYALKHSNGNKSQAALLLGISRRTLERKLKRWEQESVA